MPEAVHDSAALAHQFDDLAQQKEASTLGMWVFLVTEVLFFGGLFLVYTVYRRLYPMEFAASSRELVVWAGTINTFVLITSSLTMALGVRAAQLGERRIVMIFLALTMFLGCVFLGIKAFEYYKEWAEHHIPGVGFEFSEASYAAHAQIFFSLYFMMTGLHGFHILGGIAAISWLLVRAIKGHFSANYYTPVDLVGLYWHLVDMIWIYLFPLLYLIQ